jgi:hypothetical protein
MAGDSDNHFHLGAMMTQGFEQARKAMESYFGFFQKNLVVSPLLDSELNQKMRTYTEKNMAAAGEFVQKLTHAKDFPDFLRIQTEFMQAQWKALSDQAQDITATAAKGMTNVMKDSSS